MENDEPSKPRRKDSFDRLLQKIKREEFQKFIRNYALKNPEFKTEFEIYFSDKDSRIDVSEKYAKLIRKLIRRYSDRGFVDYRSAFGLAKEVDQLTSGGYDLVNRENFRDAFSAARPLLKGMMEVVTACDDSSGSIGGSIDYIIRLIESIAQAEKTAPVLRTEVFDFLRNELSNKLYFNYGDFGYDLFLIFQNLAVALGRHSDFVDFVDSQVSQSKGLYEGYRREFFVKQKIRFLFTVGRKDEANELVVQHIDIVEVRQGLIEEAIVQKDYSRAKSLIKEGIEIAEDKQHPGTVASWEKELLRIAKLEGDEETVRYYTRYFAFARNFNQDYYQQWKKTYSPDEWEQIIENFIADRKEKVIRQYKANKGSYWVPAQPPLLYALAPIYIEEKYWDRLLALVQRENNLSSALQYHDHLVKRFPSELLEIYLPAFEQEGDQVNGRKEYAALVRKMKKVMKDIPEGKEKVKAIVQKLKEKYPRRPAMLDELNKILV